MGGMGMAGSMGMVFTINGRVFDMNRIDETVRLGEPEIWRVRNIDPAMTHSLHVHGGAFHVLDRNGSPAHLAPHERGLKDTVLVAGGDNVRLLLTMNDYPTAAGQPYMYHCHILEHEDGGMMGQLAVSA
jgi:blue copper oxidase